MRPKSRYKKKSESTPSEDTRDKDRLISELKDRITVLENELRLKRECTPFSEVAERKQAEGALRQSERRLAEIVNHLPDATFAVDREGRVIAWNYAIEEMTGVKAADMLGKGDYEYALPLYGTRQPILIDLIFAPDEDVGRYINVKREGSAMTAEMRLPMPQGKDTALWVKASPFFDENGSPVGAIESIRDITEHKQIEEALRESEEKFRVLAETTKAGISLYRDDKSIYANPALEKMSGYTNDELLSTAVWDHVHPDYRELVKSRAMDRQRGLSVPEIYEFPIITKDGETRWVEVSAGLIMYQGEPTRMATYFDITERKLAVEALCESEARYRTLIDNSPLGIFMCDLRGNVTSINPQILEIMGSKSPEFTLSVNMLGFEPMVKSGIADILRDCITMGENRVAETSYTSYWGKSVYMRLHFTPLRDDAGQIYSVLGVMEDITERKRAEEKLKKSQYILAKSQEMAHVGNWAWNPLTGEINGSDEGYRIFGYAPGKDQLTVDRLIARVHPDDRAMLEGLLESARSEGKRNSVDYRIMRPDGSMRYVNALADKIVRDDDGNVWWVYGIMQDITERKQTEKALAEAKAEVELYVDLMGHDINNMNQSAQGFLELALQTLEMDGKIGPGGKVLIEKPLQAIEGSSKLISNVQKLQRLADEGMKTRPVDLCDLFEELGALNFHVGDRDATINIHGAPHCLVEGSDLLRDVFFNLISNAVKHAGPDRPVTIDVKAERVDQDGRAYYRCAVEDDGPGVPDELKPRLFHRFQRGTTKAHGKGLGLYIVRTLVEGYHGKVWVEDRVKGDHTKGARFVVTLPAADK